MSAGSAGAVLRLLVPEFEQGPRRFELEGARQGFKRHDVDAVETGAGPDAIRDGQRQGRERGELVGVRDTVPCGVLGDVPADHGPNGSIERRALQADNGCIRL